MARTFWQTGQGGGTPITAAALNDLETRADLAISTATAAVTPEQLGAALADAGGMTPAQETKLAGIATGATMNDTDANLRQRSTHTGTQAISTISGLQSALDVKANAQAGSNLTIGKVYATLAARDADSLSLSPADAGLLCVVLEDA